MPSMPELGVDPAQAREDVGEVATFVPGESAGKPGPMALTTFSM